MGSRDRDPLRNRITRSARGVAIASALFSFVLACVSRSKSDGPLASGVQTSQGLDQPAVTLLASDARTQLGCCYATQSSGQCAPDPESPGSMTCSTKPPASVYPPCEPQTSYKACSNNQYDTCSGKDAGDGCIYVIAGNWDPSNPDCGTPLMWNDAAIPGSCF
jgi:hypothetical protein